MGFFDFFKFTSSPLTEDAFFGQLRFMDCKDPQLSYFEGAGLFAPTGQQIEYFIEADVTGPTIAQQQFYRALQDNYAAYIARVQPLIIAEFRKWRPEFDIRIFMEEFTLLSVTIPRLNDSPTAWNMSFSTVHDAKHEITIDFLAEQPTTILIDG